MSFVTNFILTTIPGDDGQPAFFNSASALFVQVDQCFSGDKAMECDVFISAKNYADIDGIISAFLGSPWEFPENAQLLVKDDGDDQFRSYSPVSLV